MRLKIDICETASVNKLSSTTSLTFPVNHVCTSTPSTTSFSPSSLIPVALQVTHGIVSLNTPSCRLSSVITFFPLQNGHGLLF